MLASSPHAPDLARYRQLIENTPEALMLGDGAGRILDANQQALELFGYSLEELRNGPAWGLCDASDQRFHESIHTRASSGRSDFQIRMVRNDGTVFEARIWSVLFTEDGQRRSWLGVTPLASPEPARGVLLRANAMLSAVIAGAPDGIIVVDDDGNVVHVNDVFLRTWHLERDFALLPMEKRRSAAIHLLKDPGQFTREIEALRGNKDLALHDFIELVDGRTLEMHSHPLTAPGGERIGRIWYYSDVTAAMEARAELAHRDALLEAQFELSRDAMIMVGQDGTARRFNQQFLDLWGLTREQMQLPEPERMAIALPRLADPKGFQRMFDGISADGNAEINEMVRFEDGRTLEMVSAPFFLVDGTHVGRVWVFRDISARLSGQRALESADTLLEAQFSLSQDGMVVLADDGRVLRASRHFHELTHNGAPWLDLSFEERERALTELAADEAQSRAFNSRWMANPAGQFEETFELKTGGWMEIRTMPLVTASGERLGRLFVYRDVTKRRRALRALEEANALLSAQFEHAPHATLVLASDGSFIRASDSFFEFSGLPREWAALPQDERRAQLQAISADPVRAANFNERWRENPTEDLTSDFRLRDGRYFEVRSRPLIGSDGEALGRIFFYTDITERRRAETVLRESEAQLRTLMGALGEGVVLHDASGAIVLANAAAERVLGLSLDQLLGRQPTGPRWRAIREDGTLFPGDEHPATVALRTGQPVSNVVMGIHRPNGEDAWLLVNCEPLFHGPNGEVTGCVASFFDITERRKLEAAAARARQQESLAVLAGGISHKLNNLLTSIIGNTWVASRTQETTPELQASLDDIGHAAESAAALVGDLRSFASPSYLLSPNVAINDCVRSALADIPAEQRERLAINLGAALPHISANADGLRRAVVNLLENAFNSESPTVEIRTRLVDWEPGGEMVFSAAEPDAGEWLAIEIEDRGSGMERTRLERSFEPFFTTGFAGSGLGLPAAVGIVREHGGFVGLQSKPGSGTLARIFLPIGKQAP